MEAPQSMNFKASGKKKTVKTFIVLEHGTSTVKVLAVGKDGKDSSVSDVLSVAPVVGKDPDTGKALFGVDAVTKGERGMARRPVFDLGTGMVTVRCVLIFDSMVV